MNDWQKLTLLLAGFAILVAAPLLFTVAKTGTIGNVGFQNAEHWKLIRDDRGRILDIVVERDVHPRSQT